MKVRKKTIIEVVKLTGETHFITESGEQVGYEGDYAVIENDKLSYPIPYDYFIKNYEEV